MILRLLVAVALAVPAAAHAHGGSLVASGSNAAYTLTVEASEIRGEDGGPALDLTGYPIRNANGALDTGAELTFALGDGRTVRGEPTPDGLEAIIPLEERGEWRRWAISATVRGAAGTLVVRGAPVAADDGSSSTPGWLWPASAVALLAAAALVVAVRRRRPDAEPA